VQTYQGVVGVGRCEIISTEVGSKDLNYMEVETFQNLWDINKATEPEPNAEAGHFVRSRSQWHADCRMRAVEHRKCAAGLAGAHPGLQDRFLLNYTRTENAHKVRKKIFDFFLYMEVQRTFSFLFSLLRHYQMPECFYERISSNNDHHTPLLNTRIQ